jgi:hypothetical protein
MRVALLRGLTGLGKPLCRLHMMIEVQSVVYILNCKMMDKV